LIRSRIVATGSYAPERVVTNDELAGRLDTSDEWIRTRTGIGQRRVAAEGELTSDMALKASVRALEQAGWSPESLDLIIVATVSGDVPMPATAAYLQAKLGAKAAAFDISAACAGSLFGLSIADAYVRSGAARRILVVGVELLSRLVDWNDRTTAVLFGDAAGAMLVDSVPESENTGLLSIRIHTDGTQADILHIPGGGSANPLSAHVLDQRLHHIHMRGREVFKFAIRALVESASETCAALNIAPDAIDHVVPHQANIRIVDTVLERLGLPRERAIMNIERYGNTSSASVPLTLDEGVRTGRIRRGDLILLMAVGAGMSSGSALLRW
jgi:3-oxoacyl-[acyl-carrier-protein] synthase III